MANVWFTADTHFGHANIIKYCNRPFDTVQEMDEVLTQNWNNIVRPNDIVWHLGDVSFKGRGQVENYLKLLNGNIHVLFGNHDNRKDIINCRESRVINWCGDTHYMRYRGNRLFLHHYACRVWRNSHHGSYHLYGHSHGDLPGLGRSMDVGVDPNHYVPISYDEVIAKLQPATYGTHH